MKVKITSDSTCDLSRELLEEKQITVMPLHVLLGQEVLEQPIEPRPLGGMDEKALRERSHRPQDFYGKPHFMPGPQDGKVLLLVNAARCKARETELLAAKAFQNQEGLPERPDLLQALNRLSSFLYLIMIQLK